MDKVRWGIVSTGRITHQFARDIAHAPNGEVVAVASRSQASAEAFAKEACVSHASYVSWGWWTCLSLTLQS